MFLPSLVDSRSLGGGGLNFEPVSVTAFHFRGLVNSANSLGRGQPSLESHQWHRSGAIRLWWYRTYGGASRRLFYIVPSLQGNRDTLQESL